MKNPIRGAADGSREYAQPEHHQGKDDFFNLSHVPHLLHPDPPLLMVVSTRMIGGWMIGTSAMYE